MSEEKKVLENEVEVLKKENRSLREEIEGFKKEMKMPPKKIAVERAIVHKEPKKNKSRAARSLAKTRTENSLSKSRIDQRSV